MAKIKRETLKKFGCHEAQVEELMRELGHTIEEEEVGIEVRPGERIHYDGVAGIVTPHQPVRAAILVWVGRDPSFNTTESWPLDKVYATKGSRRRRVKGVAK